MTSPHGIEPVSRETLPSLAARLAASKGVPLQQLTFDLGGSVRRLVKQDRSFLDKFAAWAELEDVKLQELLSWTGEPIGEVRTRFRGEVFVSRALRNPVVQGCPQCLRENASSNPGEPLAAMAMCGHWQMREMVICVHHGRLLVPLWTAKHPDDRNDLTPRLTEILPAILSGNMESAPVLPTGYDRWLEQRLDSGQDATWLSGQNLDAATTFCRLLGGELLRLRGHEPDEPQAFRHSALAAGFDIARHGPGAIHDALHSLATAAGGFQDEPHKAFGLLWRNIREYHHENDAFGPFIDILRAVVLDVWPVAAGEVLLGWTVPQRRLHSVRSAAKELGVNERRLRPLLIEAGVVTEDDPRSDSRAIFDARANEAVLRRLAMLVRDPQMRRSAGMTWAELRALEQDGILQPRTRLPGARLRWLEADGKALVDELNALAVMEPGGAKWETIQKAQANSGVSVGRIIAAIRARKIRVHAQPGNRVYHGFMVCRGEFGMIE